MGATVKRAKNAATAAPEAPALKLLCPAAAEVDAPKQRDRLLQMLRSISRGGDINAVDKKGQTALMYAAALNERVALCWLIAKGADVTLKAKSGKTARDLTENGYSRDLLNVCEREKEPPTPDELRENNNRPTAWIYALETSTCPPGSRLSRVAAYIKRGLDLTGEDTPTWRFLQYLTRNKPDTFQKATILEQYYYDGKTVTAPSPECAALLLRHGYDARGIKFSRYTSVDMVRLLLALGVKVNEEDADTRLRAAIALGDLPTVKELTGAAEKPEPSPVYVESAPTAEMARLFLSLGYTQADSVQVSRLPYAAEILDDLLKAGLQVNEATVNAIRGNRIDLIPPLLKAGADPTDALRITISFKPRKLAEFIDLLLKAGARMPEDGRHLMYDLMKMKPEEIPERMNIMKTMLAAGAKVPNTILTAVDGNISAPRKDASEAELEAIRANILALAELLLQNGADVNAPVGDLTTLMLAARNTPRYYADLIDWMCKHGANVNSKNKHGMAALAYAKTPENLSALLRAGADVNNCDADGNTAAMEIVTGDMSADRKAELIKLLLDAGAKTDLHNKQGKTVLDLAKERKLEPVIKLLEKS